MKHRKLLNKIRMRRKKRVRAVIYGTAECPRLSVFRSNRFTYAQLIDDENQKTLAAAFSGELEKKTKKSNGAEHVGKTIAEKAKTLGIKKAVFDRGAYKYHGRVKILVEAARASGLKI